MYPFLRLGRELIRNRRRGPLALGEVHVTDVRVWPLDIDVFRELNNGRILTLMDLGRIGMLQRLGMPARLKENGWYGTVAGSAVRYRRRVTVFQKLEIRTRILGWDDRFTYFDQGLWRNGECCAHAVIRVAIASRDGIVPTAKAVEAFGFPAESPALPGWIAAWAGAETARPWPPTL